jgi:hypothetical protein
MPALALCTLHSALCARHVTVQYTVRAVYCPEKKLTLAACGGFRNREMSEETGNGWGSGKWVGKREMGAAAAPKEREKEKERKKSKVKKSKNG